ncbi:MAG: hypothetical protein PHQ40_10995 [Anaerolineaceae bacterium]|nr:hypothetical protein [Anaerolineaceae bacterium]
MIASKEKLLANRLAADEKATPVMVYTDSFLYWGDVVTKEMIRVSTWLRTNAAPDNLCLYGGMALLPGAANSMKPVVFPEIHIPIQRVLAFHIMPPVTEPIDKDPLEKNRKMEPVSAMVGQFRMDGFVRMASQIDLNKYLEVTRETYLTIYDATITHPGIAHLNLPPIPYLLVHQVSTVIAARIHTDH